MIGPLITADSAHAIIGIWIERATTITSSQFRARAYGRVNVISRRMIARFSGAVSASRSSPT